MKKGKKKRESRFCKQVSKCWARMPFSYQRTEFCCKCDQCIWDSEERNALQGCFVWVVLEQRCVVVGDEGWVLGRGLGSASKECLETEGPSEVTSPVLMVANSFCSKIHFCHFPKRGKMAELFPLSLNQGKQRLLLSSVLFHITSMGCTWSSRNPSCQCLI